MSKVPEEKVNHSNNKKEFYEDQKLGASKVNDTKLLTVIRRRTAPFRRSISIQNRIIALSCRKSTCPVTALIRTWVHSRDQSRTFLTELKRVLQMTVAFPAQ
jgi:hypothetical protein